MALVTAGPWSGVLTTDDPFDDSSSLLLDATNLYFPDPQGKCGAYARPGFSLQTPTPLDSGGIFRGQGVFSHIDLNGTTTNFCVIKGKLYRADQTFSIFTDVSPVGITISALSTSRVFGVQFGNEFVVTDGVNKPWIMTDFTATPVTGTYIQLNVANDNWTAFGKPTVYGGSLFFIVNTVLTVSYRSTLVWSAPADAATGYQQADYDFAWTIYATGVAPITAIQGTNTSLYYSTVSTIGEISGPVGPNLQSTATTASISVNVGMAIPSTVVLFGQTVFFCDAMGRPWMLPIGSTPKPIYLQMRSIIDHGEATGFPTVTARTATAVFEPTFNLYLVAIFTSSSSNDGPAVEMYAFDARSGVYEGRWIVGPGIQLETLGLFLDVNGRGSVIVLGSLLAPSFGTLADSGYIWAMKGLTSAGDFLVTEAGLYLTTEDDLSLTTEGDAELWLDNGAVPNISATTNRIGYSATQLIHVDRASLITGSDATVAISMQTASVTQTVEATPTPATTYDSMYRAVAGADIMGRGVTITAAPTVAVTQWSLQQIVLDGVPATAGPDER
jgi:hypothetical protein